MATRLVLRSVVAARQRLFCARVQVPPSAAAAAAAAPAALLRPPDAAGAAAFAAAARAEAAMAATTTTTTTTTTKTKTKKDESVFASATLQAQLSALQRALSEPDDARAERQALRALRVLLRAADPERSPLFPAQGHLASDLRSAATQPLPATSTSTTMRFADWASALEAYFARLPPGHFCRGWRVDRDFALEPEWHPQFTRIRTLVPTSRAVAETTTRNSARRAARVRAARVARTSDTARFLDQADIGLTASARDVRALLQHRCRVAVPVYHWRDPFVFGQGVSIVPLVGRARQVRWAFLHWHRALLELRIYEENLDLVENGMTQLVVKKLPLSVVWLRAFKALGWPAPPLLDWRLFSKSSQEEEPGSTYGDLHPTVQHQEEVEAAELASERRRRDIAWSIPRFRRAVRAALHRLRPALAHNLDRQLSREDAEAFVDEFEEQTFARVSPDLLQLSYEERLQEQHIRDLLAVALPEEGARAQQPQPQPRAEPGGGGDDEDALVDEAAAAAAAAAVARAARAQEEHALDADAEEFRVELMRRIQFRVQAAHELKMLRRIDRPLWTTPLNKAKFLALFRRHRRRKLEEKPAA